MFVNNLSNSQVVYITSPVFSIGNIGNYELELRYGVIYTLTPAIFELVDNATSIVVSPTSVTTTAGTCPSWPNPKISKLNYTNLSAGNYRLRVTIPASSQFFIESLRSNFNYSLTTNETANHSDYNIYPNPAKDKIYLSNLKNISKVEIYDMNGKLVRSELDVSNFVEISKLQKGNYIIKIFTDQNIFQSKLIKE